jgi:hypothetical protein
LQSCPCRCAGQQGAGEDLFGHWQACTQAASAGDTVVLFTQDQQAIQQRIVVAQPWVR